MDRRKVGSDHRDRDYRHQENNHRRRRRQSSPNHHDEERRRRRSGAEASSSDHSPRRQRRRDDLSKKSASDYYHRHRSYSPRKVMRDHHHHQNSSSRLRPNRSRRSTSQDDEDSRSRRLTSSTGSRRGDRRYNSTDPSIRTMQQDSEWYGNHSSGRIERRKQQERKRRRNEESGGGGGVGSSNRSCSYSQNQRQQRSRESARRLGFPSVDNRKSEKHRKTRQSADPSSAATRTPSFASNRGFNKKKSQGGRQSGSVHDDSIGHYQGGPGSMILDRYRVVQMVGIGTFGKVLECVDLSTTSSSSFRSHRSSSRSRSSSSFSRHPDRGYSPPRGRPDDGQHVAIKVVRDVKRYYESAKIEADIIHDINRRGGRGLSHCVVMHDAFSFGGHYCMVFEQLGPSLYDFLKRHKYKPFPITCVQDFTVQLLETLEFLHGFRLIHTDLKIENVLLANFREVDFCNQRVPESTRIKVIDFGGACYDTDKKSTVINTRQYRAPEVMLATGWSMPSDMWSAGCILAELYRGELLFATHDTTEHVALIEQVVGPFPRRMLQPARRNCIKNSNNSNVVDVNRAFDANTGRHLMEKVLSRESAAHVRKARPLEALVRPKADAWFRELLRRILVIDPEERSTAHECLQFLGRMGRDVVRNA